MTTRYAYLCRETEFDALRRMTEFEQAAHLAGSTREANKPRKSTKHQTSPELGSKAA
jgi:hypothetical protein